MNIFVETGAFVTDWSGIRRLKIEDCRLEIED